MSIYTGLVVMCDAYFAKIDKLLEKCSRVEGISDPAMDNISMEVSLLTSEPDQQDLDRSPDSSDQILFALLVRANNKRVKYSK